MFCKKCGAKLKDTDKICLNCGSLVSETVNDLYADINKDEDDDIDQFSDDSDSDTEYNAELEDLLNSYKKEDGPDYSAFKSNENSKEKNKSNNFNKDKSDMQEYTIDDLISIKDDDSYNKDYTDFTIVDDNEKKKRKFNFNNISIIPFKIIFAIGIIVMVIMLGILGYKYYKSNDGEELEYEIDRDNPVVPSKYSLKTNPNYINGKTWVCGSSKEDGSLSDDIDTYFQYDFNKNNTYAMQYLNKKESYENGTFSVSLDDISNNMYTYKLTMVANLEGGYKTRYTFTLVTNKEGTKGTYRLNSSVYSCEEMEYFNNKNR